MKIDYDYLKKMLGIFLNSEKWCVTINDFDSIVNLDDEKSKNVFLHHLSILTDRLMISLKGKPPEKGLQCLGIDFDLNGNTYTACFDWRLTADGHDFAVALNKPEVLEFIKTQLKEEGFSAVVDIVKTIVSKLWENKLKQFGLVS